jgi:hypothetical protein
MVAGGNRDAEYPSGAGDRNSAIEVHSAVVESPGKSNRVGLGWGDWVCSRCQILCTRCPS